MIAASAMKTFIIFLVIANCLSNARETMEYKLFQIYTDAGQGTDIKSRALKVFSH